MTQEFLQGLLRSANEGEHLMRHNGISFVEVTEGRVVAEMELNNINMNRWGVPHGGALFAMGDVACGVAAISVRGESLVTLNASIDYMDRACPDGKVKTVAKVERMGSKVCVCSAEMFDCNGKRIAMMKAVMSYTGTKLDVE